VICVRSDLAEEASPVFASRGAHQPVDPQLVEYIVIVVPHDGSLDVVLDAVEQLAVAGQTIVLDGAIVAREHTGVVSVSELPDSPRRPALLDTRLGVLSERDLELVAEAIPMGSLAVVVVLEDEWARPLAAAASAAGGHIAGGERIPAARLRGVLPQLRSPRWASA
jgi:hypothetical protein